MKIRSRQTWVRWSLITGIIGLSLAGMGRAETHWNFQAVDAIGDSVYNGPDVVALEGILLNRAEMMLDTDPEAPGDMGGQWQVYIQGDGADHGGTALWMGKNYGSLPWVPPEKSYTEAEWPAELCRLNHNPGDGYCFAPGDRVRVRGRWLFYKGKVNINENHNIDPAYDFTIELLEAGVGLPQPEVVTLAALKDEQDQYIFEAGRLRGCEYYQGRLIRINEVQFVNASGWDKNATLTITDGTRTFPVVLGIGAGIYPGSSNLTEPFDVVGILDQEASSGSGPFTDGYRLWVTNYDGNGRVLRDRGYRRGNLPGDVNGDGKIDLEDFTELVIDWLLTAPGLGDCN